MAHRSIATLAALTLAAATLTMTAAPAHAAGANPAWKIEVILYKNTDVTYTDAAGVSHHFVGTLVPAEVSRANPTPPSSSTRISPLSVAVISGRASP